MAQSSAVQNSTPDPSCLQGIQDLLDRDPISPPPLGYPAEFISLGILSTKTIVYNRVLLPLPIVKQSML